MQRKLNDEFIREYCEEFSEKITNDFFAEKNHISGKEILNVTPSKQVNFFVLKILFRKWQEEMKKLESPFFNYRKPEVRKAMVQFMNTLSQHIEVDSHHFSNMVEEAVADTLLLAIDPGSYLALEFEELDVANVTEKMTRPILKYLKLHKSEIEEFFAENNGADLDDFVESAEVFFEEVSVESVVRQQVELLSQILPIAMEDVYFKEEDMIQLDEDDDFPDVAEETMEDEDDQEVHFDHEEPEDEDSYDEESFTDEGDVEDELAAINDQENESVVYNDSDGEHNELSDEIETVESTDDDEPGITDKHTEIVEVSADLHEEESIEEEPQEESPEAKVQQETPEPLNEHFASTQRTVNEKYGSEGSTLADKLEQKKVVKIIEAISVNHRYMFTKELFDGDRDAFANAIEQIEQCKSFDDAVELLVQSYANKRGWDMNSDEVKELLKVIFRKFR